MIPRVPGTEYTEGKLYNVHTHPGSSETMSLDQTIRDWEKKIQPYIDFDLEQHVCPPGSHFVYIDNPFTSEELRHHENERVAFFYLGQMLWRVKSKMSQIKAQLERNEEVVRNPTIPKDKHCPSCTCDVGTTTRIPIVPSEVAKLKACLQGYEKVWERIEGYSDKNMSYKILHGWKPGQFG